MKIEANRYRLAAAALAASAVLLAACGQDNPTAPASSAPPVSQAPALPQTPSSSGTAETILAGASDAAITGKVKAAMVAEPGLKALAIDVDTKDKVVTLTGSVDSPAAKERAIQVAGTVDGVSSVVDQLTVKM